MLGQNKWYNDHDDATEQLLSQHGYEIGDFLETLSESDYTNFFRLKNMNEWLAASGDGILFVTAVEEHDEDTLNWQFVLKE